MLERKTRDFNMQDAESAVMPKSLSRLYRAWFRRGAPLLTGPAGTESDEQIDLSTPFAV
jgi:hypothetical protein